MPEQKLAVVHYDPRVKYNSEEDSVTSSVVWTSQSVQWAYDAVMLGQRLHRSPFFEGDPARRKGNIVFQMSDWELTEFVRCSQDFHYFLKTYCKIKLDDSTTGHFDLRDYQEDNITDLLTEAFVIMGWSRQSGKSISVSLYILWRTTFKPDFTTALLANKAKTSGEILKKIKAIYLELPFWMQPGVMGWNGGTVSLDNGSRILTAPATLDALNSLSCQLLYCDEFAFVGRGANKKEYQREFLANAIPIISSLIGGQIIISSTPNGKDYFYELFDGAMKGNNAFKASKVLWWQIPGRTKEWAQKQISIIGIDKFKIQYEMSFDTSSESLLSIRTMKRLSKWRKSFSNEAYDILTKYEQYLYMDDGIELDFENDVFLLSVDIAEGLKQDYSVIQILRIEFDEDLMEYFYRQVGVWKSNEIGVEDFSDVTAELFNIFNPDYSKLLVEHNTYGELLFTYLKLNDEYEVPYESILKFRRNSEDEKMIKGVRVNTQIKQIAVKSFKTMMDSAKLIVQETKTVEEVENFQKTKKGTYKAAIGHDDMVTPLTNFAYFVQLSDVQFINWLEDFGELNGYQLDPTDNRNAAKTRALLDEEIDKIDAMADCEFEDLDPKVMTQVKQILGLDNVGIRIDAA